jgi:arylformamidase
MARIIDLSLPIYHGCPGMPLDPKCAVIVHHTIDSMKYNITQLSLSTHQGTHLDAPFHFFNKGISVDELELSKCAGPTEIFDLPGLKARYSLTPADLRPYQSKIKKGSRIILRTNWWKKFPKKQYFFDGPMISVQLAQYLAKKKIAMLGVETPGVHPVEWEKVHKTLLKAGIIIVEGLAYLNKIKKDRIFFVALPLKIKGRDGSPVRAIAIEDVETLK